VLLLLISALGLSCGRVARARQQGDGLQARSIDVHGVTRTYSVHVPDSYRPGTGVPLVLVLHGLGGSGMQVARDSGFVEEADRGGFIVAFPDGREIPALPGNGRGWIVSQQPRTDLDFIDQLLTSLESEFSVDHSRTFVAGHSNGAVLAYRIACDLSGRVAAIAPVAGATVNNCNPAEPVSVLHIHGTADPLVPYEGGRAAFGFTTISVEETQRRWSVVDGCDATPSAAPEAGPAEGVTRTSYSGCAAGSAVELVTIAGGGHAWPRERAVGRLPAAGFDATAAIWRFFEAHPRSP
jgi:polyhydroxybutyrate depolymerase